MRIQTLLLLLAVSGMSWGCASAPKGRVLQTESGHLAAMGVAKEEPDARMAALDEAQEFCQKRSQSPVFQDEDLKSKSKKGFSLEGLKNLPYIGRVFKSDGKSQVTVDFRCSKEAVA